MANNILSANKIEINNVSFVVGQAKSGRNPPITMKYSGQNFQIRLPSKMLFPGGVLVREDEQTKNKSYTLIGSLKGCDPYGRDKSADGSDDGALYNLLLALEEHIQQQAFENSVKWFGKKRSLEAIRDSFKKIISVSSDKVGGEYIPNGKYPPSFRVKVPVYDGSVKSDIIDNVGNPIYSTPESLVSIFPKGITANLIMSGSIYVIAGGGFGVTWRLTYAQVFPYMKLTAADVFKSEEGDDVPEDEEQEPTQSQPLLQEEVQQTPPQVQEQQPPPQAPVKKRRAALS
jgi:hypothetical protein